ncbi:MAG: ATP-binding protein [Deltaproteobacteria bacterium]|nr:ATP-binding protein [Deltaproteobacteria bacterium]
MKSLNTILEAHRRERDRTLKRTFVSRQLGGPLSKSLSSNLVKVITGPRRAGKSTLAFQVLADKRFAYLNFEDDALRGDEVTSDELIQALEAVYGKTDFLFFDEIQNYPHWESFINKLHRREYNLLITGSNSRLLSRELGSALTGRHLSFELLPFSFQEFLLALGKKKGDDPHLFQRYLSWGGFPEVALGGAEPSGYLRTLFDSVVLRDIVTRHRIRLSTAIHDLLNLLMNNAACRFSARSLERSLGSLSTATIQKFIAYCREAYLVQDLQPYFFKPRMRVKADRKIYAFDNGFISAKSQPATSNDSRLLENLVFVELVRRGFQPNIDLFYYQTRSGTEVDFLIRKGSKNLELLQVTQNLSSLKTREREIRALLQGAKELNIRKLTVITLDTEEAIRESGTQIRVIPCPTWLTSGS